LVWKSLNRTSQLSKETATSIPKVTPIKWSTLIVKGNLPSTAPPKPLEDSLTGIRTEMLSSKLNHVHVHDNISTPEREAIKNLVELRKPGSIVIAP
jgi:hypothetical protein